MRPRQAACGTRSGYHRHLRNHETPCDPCREANATYRRQRHNYKPRTPATCGTPNGYRHHKRHKQYPCQPCVDAMRAAWTDRRQALKGQQ